MPNEWMALVKKVHAQGKKSGMSFRQAMVKAKGMYKKKTKTTKKKARRKRAKMLLCSLVGSYLPRTLREFCAWPG